MKHSGKPKNHKKSAIKLAVFAVLMFGFGFALVPLYDVFCDITGLNGRYTVRTPAAEANVQAGVVNPSERRVTVQFISQVSRGMPWDFSPKVSQIEVQPGETHEVVFLAKNRADTRITGQAVPSVSPGQAILYLQKTECFCFYQQHLNPGEAIEMPLRFYIDESIPDDIHTITLSYTLYNVTGKAPVTNKPSGKLGSPER